MIVINVLPGGQPHLPARIKAIDLDTRVALSFDTALVLNTPAAERAGLKSFPLIGKGKFENAMIPGGEARFRWNLFGVTPAGAAKGTVPVVWVDKAVAADADGVLPASVIKADRIIFDLGPQAPAAKVRTILRKSGGSVLMKTRIGDETINVALELNSPDTVMNARAAAALAGAGLVKRAGDVGFWRPFPGVSLPFERMVPTAGAAILGLPLVRPAVRITEAQAREIDSRARAGTSTASDDDDAITVTASRKRGRDPWILIGRDVLNQCSRIVFDRPGKAWVLTCAF
ncbi:hypothetical protein [Polymorphobacter fuscus]|uniref:Uncharacterized protein n=1 Tax=Sandarakinorhabdus fusca TaxID=1439888 RepID=A0A7C9GPG5_9SPHN|nr:hypothetical protein [Polymorphobacter fuscus]KAB7646312.1 hypothetical protein F9290_09705 [Polymorphobacter fuscus]MQT17535.1 hypothetical protein [Polymorphobacter fuscus]NJC09923.1 hypothetical protein [Polymorphobacter fuscus]